MCRRVKGGIFFFLLNGKRWVSCSDEPALHQVLVILGVCAQLPHCVRSWQETLCGDTLSLGPGPERRKCFFTVTFEYLRFGGFGGLRYFIPQTYIWAVV